MKQDPRTFLPSHLNTLKARAAAVTTDADADALAAALVVEGRDGHIGSATYERENRRINIALHPGAVSLAFTVAIGDAIPPAVAVVHQSGNQSTAHTLTSDGAYRVAPAVAVEV